MEAGGLSCQKGRGRRDRRKQRDRSDARWGTLGGAIEAGHAFTRGLERVVIARNVPYCGQNRTGRHGHRDGPTVRRRYRTEGRSCRGAEGGGGFPLCPDGVPGGGGTRRGHTSNPADTPRKPPNPAKSAGSRGSPSLPLQCVTSIRTSSLERAHPLDATPTLFYLPVLEGSHITRSVP